MDRATQRGLFQAARAADDRPATGMCTSVVRRPIRRGSFAISFVTCTVIPFSSTLMTLGHDRHRRGDTGAERRRDEVGRRKGFSFPLIIERCIGREDRARGTMRRAAMQFTGVIDRNLNHQSSSDAPGELAKVPLPNVARQKRRFLNLITVFLQTRRETLRVRAGSCRMIRSELCAGTSSFSQLSFHQQNPMIAGQRPENRSRRAARAQAAAVTLRW